MAKGDIDNNDIMRFAAVTLSCDRTALAMENVDGFTQLLNTEPLRRDSGGI